MKKLAPILLFTLNASAAFAQESQSAIPSSLKNAINSLVNPLIGILVGIALIIFFWGILEFVANAGNEEARTTGKRNIIWGLLGFTIIFGVWGIIRILQSFFETGVGIGGGFLT